MNYKHEDIKPFGSELVCKYYTGTPTSNLIQVEERINECILEVVSLGPFLSVERENTDSNVCTHTQFDIKKGDVILVNPKDCVVTTINTTVKGLAVAQAILIEAYKVKAKIG